MIKKYEVTCHPVIFRLNRDNILIPEAYSLHTNGPSVGAVQLCSSGGTSYIPAKQNIEVTI